MPREKAQVEEVSRCRMPGTDYVTVILDVWEGDNKDPAVGIQRYVGLWDLEHLPDEMNVTTYYGRYEAYAHDTAHQPFVWEHMSEVKKKDRTAELYKHEQGALLGDNAPHWARDNDKRSLYQAFMDAIDRLAENNSDEDAWAAVDAYREHQAVLHEK